MPDHREELTPLQMQKRFRVTITLHVTTPMLRGLQAFLDRLGYEYTTSTEAELSNV